MERQLSVTYNGVDSDTPLNERLNAKYMRTFAYHTVKDRLPVILTTVVDQLSRDKEEIIRKYGQDAEEDIKSATGKISKLKNEVQTNKVFIKLESTAEDVDDWNKYLASLEAADDAPCWFQSPWLYAECYMYRRLSEIFENSKLLKKFDHFAKHKSESFRVLVNEAKLISNVTLNILQSVDISKSDCKEKFIQMLKMSLWSNRCDLSLSNGANVGEGESISSNIKQLDSCLLRDDSEQVFELLKRQPGKVIDLIHDNAPYELLTDLCLCDFLCATGLASEVRLHVKKIPWYVSDVMRHDIDWLLNKLDEEGETELSGRWRRYLREGIWTVHDDKYWISPFDFSDMKQREPALYEILAQSVLVILKGDLNYRKLMGDINWDHTENFEVAIRDFRPTNVLSLRTVKADLICGLAPGQSESLFQKDPFWMRTGEYGLIQFCLSRLLSIE